MYGAGSPKRQWAWSNSKAIQRLDVGWKKMKAQYSTVKHYYDKKGVKRYHGTKALRLTEQLGYDVCRLNLTMCTQASRDFWPPFDLWMT